MRKFFICADMEGCGAVSSSHALMPDRWEWAAARRWMTEEVIAVSQAAFDAGYQEVIVADSHGNAHNIDPDVLPDNIRLVRSWPRAFLMMQGVEMDGVEACALIGHHAGASAQGSVLAHSFSSSAIREVRLNGHVCSEGYIGAAFAGEFGRPVVFVSGDEITVHDVRHYAPEAVTFVSKQSLGIRSQMSLPPAQTRRMLKEKAAEGISRRPSKPFVLRGPLRLELEMTTQAAAEMLAYLPNVERVNAWTVAVELERMRDVMRFISFTIFYSPRGAIAY